MKVEATPWWGLLVGGALAAVWAWQSFTYFTFAEEARRQFNRPQLKSGESRFGRMVERLDLHDLEPYQLVRFRLPRASGELTSRIVALEGQRVRLEGGEVFVDGAPFDDRYRGGRPEDTAPEQVIPEGCVYVLNDVRTGISAAYDSRTLGPVPLRAITRRFAARERKRR